MPGVGVVCMPPASFVGRAQPPLVGGIFVSVAHHAMEPAHLDWRGWAASGASAWAYRLRRAQVTGFGELSQRHPAA